MPGTVATDPADFAAWLDQATSENHLPNPWLTLDRSETNLANSKLYIRALRSRLDSLAYLTEELEVEVLTPALGAAIRRFQADAGLVEDGWAGPLTKQRLQQLVSFEEAQDVDSWDIADQNPGNIPAVRRAAYLRLYTLGFMDWSDKLTPATVLDPAVNADFREALQGFIAVAEALGLSDRTLAPALSTRVLQLLFGHDAIIGALAIHPAFVDDRANSKFVDAIGRVELWLLDYDVKLANGNNIRFQAAPPRAAVATLRVDAVQDALADLRHRFTDARLLGAGLFETPKFSASFFALTSSLNAEPDETFDPVLEDRILTIANEQSTEIMARLGKLAARAWDGLKRLWGFLKNLLTTAAATIKDELWRITRFVATRARGAFEVVLKAIEIIHRGSVYLKSRVFPASKPEVAVLAFCTDFDVAFFAQQEAPYAGALDIIGQDVTETRFFVAACKILGALLGALVEVARVVVAAASMGWFLILLSLARIASRLQDVIDAVDDIDIESLKRFDATDAGLYKNLVI